MDEFNPGGGTLGAIGAAITAFIGGFFCSERPSPARRRTWLGIVQKLT